MKHSLFIKTRSCSCAILLVLSILSATVALHAQPLYLGEFNIRNDNAKDAVAGNGWAVRCPVVCDILKVEAFDIFGVSYNLFDFFFVP